MRRIMSGAVCLCAWALASAALASNPVGIYALVEKVAFEPSDSEPQRVRIDGAFILADRSAAWEYESPRRGFLYFALPPGKEDVARAEWADLQGIAGTGDVVAFGNRWIDLPTVRTGPALAVPGVVSWNHVLELIAQLNNDNQSARDAATEQLERMGSAIERGLREELEKPQPRETRLRIERIVSRLTPDIYPLGFGVTRMAANASGPSAQLQKLPLPISPPDGERVRPGGLTLTAKAPPRLVPAAKFVLEIQGESGAPVRSDPIAPAGMQIRWSPPIEIQPGEKYTWRIWTVGLEDQYGWAVASSFRGEAGEQ